MLSENRRKQIREEFKNNITARNHNQMRIHNIRKQIEQIARENEAEYILCGLIIPIEKDT